MKPIKININISISIILSLLTIFTLSTGCSRSIIYKKQFLAYPNEIDQTEINKNSLREVLFDKDYLILAVTKEERKIKPVQHYRSEHTFGSNVWPITVNFENPQHISSFIIIDKINTDIGIAIKKEQEKI